MRYNRAIKRNEGYNVRTIGNIDKEIFSCISSDIVTDEVVITDERLQHIEEHHPGAFAEIEPYLQIAIQDPDYIISDSGRKNTGLVLKMIEEEEIRFQIVLRVQTSENSIISAWRIREKEWNRLIRNKVILYKRG